MNTLLNKLCNSMLSFKYQFTKQKRIYFTGKKTVFNLSNINNSDNGYVSKDDAFYKVVSSDCTEIKSDGIHIYTKYYGKNVINWSTPETGTYCEYKSSWLDFSRQVYSKAYGTWEIKLKYSKYSRPAIWMLRERYGDMETAIEYKISGYNPSEKSINLASNIDKFLGINNLVYRNETDLKHQIDIGTIIKIDGNTIYLDKEFQYVENSIWISRDNITPEIDILEIINKKYTQTIHWDLKLGTYDPYQLGSQVSKYSKNDWNYIEVAVKVSENGYEFYINGIKTTVVYDGISDKPAYIILNNNVASDIPMNFESELIITEINYYE